MKTIVVVVGPTAVQRASEKARAVGSAPISGVAAPTSAALLGLVDEAWGAIESALTEAYEFGTEKGSQAYEWAVAKIDELAKKAGARAKELHQQLVQRLSIYSQELIATALSQMTATIRVGEVNLSIASVTCTQKLSLSGSLKVNIKELIELLAEGELDIETNYTREN